MNTPTFLRFSLLPAAPSRLLKVQNCWPYSFVLQIFHPQLKILLFRNYPAKTCRRQVDHPGSSIVLSNSSISANLVHWYLQTLGANSTSAPFPLTSLQNLNKPIPLETHLQQFIPFKDAASATSWAWLQTSCYACPWFLRYFFPTFCKTCSSVSCVGTLLSLLIHAENFPRRWSAFIPGLENKKKKMTWNRC